MNEPELHFENSNLNEYDIDRDNHADKKYSSKGKRFCSIDIFSATKVSDNPDEEDSNLKIVIITMMTILSTSLSILARTILTPMI